MNFTVQNLKERFIGSVFFVCVYHFLVKYDFMFAIHQLVFIPALAGFQSEHEVEIPFALTSDDEGG